MPEGSECLYAHVMVSSFHYSICMSTSVRKLRVRSETGLIWNARKEACDVYICVDVECTCSQVATSVLIHNSQLEPSLLSCHGSSVAEHSA